MIKRYDLFQIHPCGQDRRGEMRQAGDGEFVAYEDVKHFLPPLPASRDELFERVAAAIDDADFGYSLQLTRLIDGVSEYTLTRSDGAEPLTFSDSDEAYQYIRLQKLLRKAAAAIAVMNPTPSQDVELPDWVIERVENCVLSSHIGEFIGLADHAAFEAGQDNAIRNVVKMLRAAATEADR